MLGLLERLKENISPDVKGPLHEVSSIFCSFLYNFVKFNCRKKFTVSKVLVTRKFASLSVKVKIKYPQNKIYLGKIL